MVIGKWTVPVQLLITNYHLVCCNGLARNRLTLAFHRLNSPATFGSHSCERLAPDDRSSLSREAAYSSGSALFGNWLLVSKTIIRGLRDVVKRALTKKRSMVKSLL